MSAFFRDVNDWLANPAVFVLAVLAAWALAVIALTAIGRRLERRTQIKRWKSAWREAQARGGHPVILAPTSFQERFFANARPDGACRHDTAVAVEDLSGEIVAALCPDCGVQLGAEYAPKPAPDLNGALYETLRDQP